MTIDTLVNHQVRLAQRPVGTPTRDNWSFTSEPVAEPAPGGVLIKTLALSLDPAMRGWMNEGKSYIPPVGIGEVMRAGGVGKVIASQNPKFAVGDLVSGGLGVQEYLLVPEDQVKRSGLFRIDGTCDRPDGSIYHITWSIDRARGRKPVESNDVIARLGWRPVEPPVPVRLQPDRF